MVPWATLKSVSSSRVVIPGVSFTLFRKRSLPRTEGLPDLDSSFKLKLLFRNFSNQNWHDLTVITFCPKASHEFRWVWDAFVLFLNSYNKIGLICCFESSILRFYCKLTSHNDSQVLSICNSFFFNLTWDASSIWFVTVCAAR